jgi:hypothetical protein
VGQAARLSGVPCLIRVVSSWQLAALFLALLAWLGRKDYEGIPKIYITPDPPPYLIFRLLKRASQTPDSESKAEPTAA